MYIYTYYIYIYIFADQHVDYEADENMPTNLVKKNSVTTPTLQATASRIVIGNTHKIFV